MAELFTKNGDDGKTGFLGKGRISKAHPRIEALGSIDEASAALGMVRASGVPLNVQEIILTIQRDLYSIMAEVAASSENKEKFDCLVEERISWLETQANHYSSQVRMPSEFILPGDSETSAIISFARTVIRRAERRLVELKETGEEVNSFLIQYLNRLSSLCFILEIFESNHEGKKPTSSKQDTSK